MEVENLEKGEKEEKQEKKILEKAKFVRGSISSSQFLGVFESS